MPLIVVGALSLIVPSIVAGWTFSVLLGNRTNIVLALVLCIGLWWLLRVAVAYVGMLLVLAIYNRE